MLLYVKREEKYRKKTSRSFYKELSFIAYNVSDGATQQFIMCQTGPHSRFSDGEVKNLDTDKLGIS
jgi:hypothetical protein